MEESEVKINVGCTGHEPLVKVGLLKIWLPGQMRSTQVFVLSLLLKEYRVLMERMLAGDDLLSGVNDILHSGLEGSGSQVEPNSDGGNEAEQKWDRLGWPRKDRLIPDNGVIITISL